MRPDFLTIHVSPRDSLISNQILKILRSKSLAPDVPKNTHHSIKKVASARCTPLIPAPERQRRVGLCEFKASLIYKS